MVASLRGSVGTGTKKDESSIWCVWATGFHHVTACSLLARVLKLMKCLFLQFSIFFSVRDKPWITETADTESADMGVRLYRCKCKESLEKIQIKRTKFYSLKDGGFMPMFRKSVFPTSFGWPTVIGLPMHITHLLTYSMEKLTGFQLVEKFCTFCTFVTALTSARHLSLLFTYIHLFY